MKKNFALLTLILSSIFFFQIGYSQDLINPLVTNTLSYSSSDNNGKITGSSEIYKGSLSLPINLYRYKDADFDLSISINYSTTGFKPNQRSSIVGYGWSLDVGGIISRKINGLPDDQNTNLFTYNGNLLPCSVSSFYDLSKSNINEDRLLIKYAIDSVQKSKMIFLDTLTNNYYDTEPDIFYFNFNGYSGSFHLWYNDSIKTFSTTTNAKNIKVLIEKDSNEFNIITLTTPDGYKYLFGGTNNKEYNNYSRNRQIVTGWKLSQIIAPNGRKIDYIYSERQTKFYIPTPVSTFTMTYYDDIFNGTRNDYIPMIINGVAYNYITTNSLNKIIIDDDVNILFGIGDNFGEKAKDFALYISYGQFVSPILKLIEVSKKGMPLTQYEFKYDHSTDTTDNNILFLKEVKINNYEKYLFEYNNLNSCLFPEFGTTLIDHWGYYNSEFADLAFKNQYNIVKTNSFYDEDIINDVRIPDLSKTKLGVLTKITYPKGGYMTIEYEQNTYRYSVERTSASSFFPHLWIHSENKLTGGVRVKNLKTYVNNLLADCQTYIYNDSLGRSNGIQTFSPRYGIIYYSKNNNGKYKFVRTGSINHIIPNFNSTNIEYSQVKVVNKDSSYVVYNYSTIKDFPDSLITTNTNPNLFPPKIRNITPTWTFINGDINNSSIFYPVSFNGNLILPYELYNLRNVLSPVISYNNLRGKILQKNVYDNNKNLIEKKLYKYRKTVLHKRYSPIFTAEECLFTKDDSYELILDSTIHFQFSKNGARKTVEEYKYNNLGQLNKYTITNASGNKTIKNLIYINDIHGSANYISTDIYNFMINNNYITNPIIEEELFVDKNNLTKIIKRNKYTYTIVVNNSQFLCLSKVETFNKEKLQYELEFENTMYNKYGYVLERKTKDNKYFSYIWSYNNKLPIVKAENIKYNSISSIILSDPTLCNIFNETPPEYKVNYLHNKLLSSISSSAIFETYLYDNWRGNLLLRLDSKNLKNYYQYDNIGQLLCIRDNNRNILERYAYHYQNGSTPEALQIPENNIGAKLTCTLSGNGTLGNNNSLLRVGDTINLGVIFPVTPSQYYEFDGYYVNGVMIPNPAIYIVQGDVQIEARTKEVASAELIIRFGESLLMETAIAYDIKQRGESLSSGRIFASLVPSASIITRPLSYPIQISLAIDATVPSLKITIDGIVIFESMGQVPSGHVIDYEFTEFGPHEIVIEIP